MYTPPQRGGPLYTAVYIGSGERIEKSLILIPLRFSRRWDMNCSLWSTNPYALIHIVVDDVTWIMHRNHPSERWPRSAGDTSCVSNSV
jgi:hypothetical protein